MLKLFLYPLLVLFLSACGGGEIVHKPQPLTEISNPIKLISQWNVGVGTPDNRHTQKAQPFVFDNVIYTVDTAGEINAVDKTGKLLWQKQLGLKTSSIASNGKLIIVTTLDGKIIAYTNSDFKHKWTHNLKTSITVKPLFLKDKVLIRSVVGKISAHSLFDGALQWTYQQRTPVLSSHGSSDMILDDNRIIIGFDNGYLAVINPVDGKAFWESLRSEAKGLTELDRINDIDSQMLVDAGFVYFIGADGMLSKMNIKTAQLVWKVKQSSYTGIAGNKELLFISDKNSNIVAISKDTGIKVWKQEGLLYRQTTMPGLLGKHLLVADIEGYVHVLSANTGDIIGRQFLDVYGINVAPVVNNNHIYVQSLGSYLTSLSL